MDRGAADLVKNVMLSKQMCHLHRTSVQTLVNIAPARACDRDRGASLARIPSAHVEQRLSSSYVTACPLASLGYGVGSRWHTDSALRPRVGPARVRVRRRVLAGPSWTAASSVYIHTKTSRKLSTSSSSAAPLFRGTMALHRPRPHRLHPRRPPLVSQEMA